VLIGEKEYHYQRSLRRNLSKSHPKFAHWPRGIELSLAGDQRTSSKTFLAMPATMRSTPNISVGRVGMVTPSGRCKFRRGVIRATIPTNNNIVPSFFTRRALLYSDRSTGRFWAARTGAKRCSRRPQARPLRQLKLQQPAPLRPPEFLSLGTMQRWKSPSYRSNRIDLINR
jgi:hypothetical protein